MDRGARNDYAFPTSRQVSERLTGWLDLERRRENEVPVFLS